MNLKPGVQISYAAARLAARFRPCIRTPAPLPERPAEPGISVVIPSRNGKDLLAAQLPGILHDLPTAAEILVVDNGSDDGTEAWLRASYPQVKIEVSRAPLSFARAANRGLEAARYSRICLLNNDMLIDPGFFRALDHAFDRVPNLFCATAQIRFPPGVRREETGKAVMSQSDPEDFPLRCDEPLPNEDLTYVLYGSGGCSLYDAAMLRALSGIDTVYEPAYVEDLDLGFRAWQRDWPSVYVAAAGVEHRHRATTSRYYTAEQLDSILEINYLKFLARSVASPQLFRKLWQQALHRLRRRAPRDQAAARALRQAAAIAREGGPAVPSQLSEDSILALTNGTVFVFPGHEPTGKPRVVIAGKSLPEARDDEHDVIAIAIVDDVSPFPHNVLKRFVEIILVRSGTSWSLSLGAVFHQTIKKWQPITVHIASEFMAHTPDGVPSHIQVIES